MAKISKSAQCPAWHFVGPDVEDPEALACPKADTHEAQAIEYRAHRSRMED